MHLVPNPPEHPAELGDELQRFVARAVVEQAARRVCDVWRDPLASSTQLLAALAVLSVSLDLLDKRRGGEGQ